MDNIIEPNIHFDFSTITLSHPINIPGGAYFTKIEFNKKPLYIQTSKSLTKQGFVKSGKKYYLDLLFDNTSFDLINWFENLEDRCHKLIYEKKDEWFQGNLEENDVETAFTPVIRIYKSGKYYLLRTNVKNIKDNEPAIRIYDENQQNLNFNDIHSVDTEIITILEIQGIKFTTRNFQIEIELKQMMVMNKEPIFDNCLIKTHTPNMHSSSLNNNNHNLDNDLGNRSVNKSNNDLENITDYTLENKIDDNKLYEINDLSKNDELVDLLNQTNDNLAKNNETIDLVELTNDDILKTETTDTTDVNTLNNLEKMNHLENNKNKDITEKNLNIELDIQELPTYIENNDELREITDYELHLDDKNTINLRPANEVYFKLYKEARDKAKLAKKNAILAYLEAKKIRRTYMIDYIDESDGEFDEEIDDVSESELEEL